ncbi:MAG TPA: hypothetical protein VMW74_04295 [Nitrosopumilaceae archaeon]|nr:hypothetical protein [Nitrosopumilaceae archaeon]
MNPKIFVIAAIAIMVGILGVIFMMTSTADTSDDGSAQELQNQVESITVKLEDVSILQVSDRAAVIEIKFKLENPNSRSVIAQMLQYSLYSSSGSEEYKIASSQIGSMPEGMVDGSNYYTLLSNNSILLKDKIILDYPGNSPELMSILENSKSSWKAEGDVFFNLSSMTSGQGNQIHFESRK